MGADLEDQGPSADLDAGLRAAFATGRAERPSAAAPVPAPAERLGYAVEAEIARGGMGVILKAFDRDLTRDVALKVLREDLASEPRLVRRFFEEARITARLDHPGIVPVHQVGLDAHGRPYFAMRLVRGRDLQVILSLANANEEGWSQTRALSVILKVCEAMAYAHGKGVIHRDLKPPNVMVGEFGEVYVMDWGLARVIGGEDTHDLRLRSEPGSGGVLDTSPSAADSASPLVTMDGDVLGTPSYMSPEQAQGRIAELGPRSDVYSVGALLYQLLGKEVPYVPAGTRVPSRAVLEKLLQGPPRPLHELRQDLAAELIAICERAMARDPKERYPDMSSMADDMRAFLERRVVRAYETGAWAEAKKWVRRNKPLAASLAAAVLLLVAGLTTSLVYKFRADQNAKAISGLLLKNLEVNRDLASKSVEAEARRREAEQHAKRADFEAQQAVQRADEVLRLSALQDIDDLIARAGRLWPAYPENVERYREWLQAADDLADDLPSHEAQLAALRARAIPWSAAEESQFRSSHPRLPERDRVRRELEFLRRRRAAIEAAEPSRVSSAEEAELDGSMTPADARTLDRSAWALVDPERKDWGEESRGLALARRALDLAASRSPEERAPLRATLSWALLACGRIEEAVVEAEAAVEEAGAVERAGLERQAQALEEAVDELIGPEGLEAESSRVAELEHRLERLEVELSTPVRPSFADRRDRWWHDQLEKLVSGIRSLTDPATGLHSRGISPEHGWGVRKRLEFALQIRQRSIESPDAAERWREACASIADRAECPLYAGLRLTPQLGLLPIGRDPESGLWEFAHLQTGQPATRASGGKLIMAEETGLVLVLLPGGTFRMGAQSRNPSEPNYDPQAVDFEGPVHEVALPPFFLSRFEMTQGQWLRATGRNPSFYRENRRLAPSLLHPVEQVSWTTSAEVCQRLGLVLPSEARWEYGARAGSTTVWWTGDEKESLLRAVNLADRTAARFGMTWRDILDWPELDDGYAAHAPVDTFRPNPFGLHHVHGNVLEWCLDPYEDYPESSRPDPIPLPPGFLMMINRGGCYDYSAVGARSALRNVDEPGFSDYNLGLRPAQDVTP